MRSSNPSRDRAGFAKRLGLAALLVALAVTCTGGAPSVRRSVGGTVPPGHPRAALLPFENLAGREEQSQIFTRVFFAQLVASGALEMIDPARVEAAMDSLGMLSSGSLTPPALRVLADTLDASYLLLGSVLESTALQSGGVTIPSVGATLRLVQPDSTRVAWAGVHFRSGEDNETVFGWGRVTSAERLILELASDMLQDFREAGARYAKSLRAEK